MAKAIGKTGELKFHTCACWFLPLPCIFLRQELKLACLLVTANQSSHHTSPAILCCASMVVFAGDPGIQLLRDTKNAVDPLNTFGNGNLI